MLCSGDLRACRYVLGAKDLEIRKFGSKGVIEKPRIGAGQGILDPDRLACPREGSIRRFQPLYVTQEPLR